jgi:lipoprotein-anchoring transpeptidase ErfK/SrfK
MPSSVRLLALGLCLAASAHAAAQDTLRPPADTVPRPLEHGLIPRGTLDPASPDSIVHLRTAEDSAAWRHAKSLADASTGRRIVISLLDRRLWLIDGGDTLRAAPIAVGKGTVVEWQGRRWRFDTPRGRRRVLSKTPDPVWVPPDWHYVEHARRRGYTLRHLPRGGARLAEGARLAIQGDSVVHVAADGTVSSTTQSVLVYGDTMYIPPLGTANRRIRGELGAFKMDLGGGYLIHGTNEQRTIGSAVTHGCVRVGSADLEFVYHATPLGTPVYIY